MKLEVTLLQNPTETNKRKFIIWSVSIRIPWNIRKINNSIVKKLIKDRLERRKIWIDYREKTGRPISKKDKYSNSLVISYSLEIDLDRLDMIEKVYDFLK